MGDIYPVAVSFKHDQQLTGSGYVATVRGGHRKVKYLFAFGDSRKEAGTALAKVIYDTLARSRYDLSNVSAIVLIETHLVPLGELDTRSDEHNGCDGH